jgi:hypothetical protein
VENKGRITNSSRGRKRDRIKESLLEKKERRDNSLLSSVAEARLRLEL